MLILHFNVYASHLGVLLKCRFEVNRCGCGREMQECSGMFVEGRNEWRETGKEEGRRKLAS